MSTRRKPSDDSLERLIDEIHNKLDGVVFNGGFETLVTNVQNIQKTQEEMLLKMEDVHKVIYEPDDGLFARVKRVETSHDRELEPLRRELTDMVAWKSSMTGKEGHIALAEQAHKDVQELNAWKKRIIALVVTAAGSTLLMGLKTLYEVLKDHVSLH
jgi:hypothetical protein